LLSEAPGEPVNKTNSQQTLEWVGMSLRFCTLAPSFGKPESRLSFYQPAATMTFSFPFSFQRLYSPYQQEQTVCNSTHIWEF
jgi:hypothetical protein